MTKSINNYYVEYNEALELRTLEFDLDCNAYYFGKDKEIQYTDDIVPYPISPRLNSKVMFRAPYYIQVFKWINNKYNIRTMFVGDNITHKMYSVDIKTDKQIFITNEFNNIENMLLNYLQELIKYIKNDK